jgi:hypothetical protein
MKKYYKDDLLKIILLLLTFLLSSAFLFAAGNTRPWSKCKLDTDCKINNELGCDGLCYNKKFEKDALEWEKNIVWDCMAEKKKRIPRCVKNVCLCTQKMKSEKIKFLNCYSV